MDKESKKKLGIFETYAEGALELVKWTGVILVAGIAHQIGIRFAAKIFEQKEDTL